MPTHPHQVVVTCILNFSPACQNSDVFACISQASAFETQGRATIARLVMKFRGYRRVKSCTPPTK